MDDGIFQWDDAKAIANVERHGVAFEAAREAFKDPFALEWVDESQNYGEHRFTVIGMAENHLLVIAYTMRGESVRIISARLAEPFERRRYHEENRS
jgi:uncharacterized protein